MRLAAILLLLALTAAPAFAQTPPEIVMASINQVGEILSPQQMIDRIGEFAELGVTTVATNFHVDTRAEWLDRAEKFAEEIISKV